MKINLMVCKYKKKQYLEDVFIYDNMPIFNVSSS